MTIFGLRVFENPLAVKLVVRRVRGGYLNRWLIREVVFEPAMFIAGPNLFVHPTIMPQLRSALDRS